MYTIKKCTTPKSPCLPPSQSPKNVVLKNPQIEVNEEQKKKKHNKRNAYHDYWSTLVMEQWKGLAAGLL